MKVYALENEHAFISTSPTTMLHYCTSTRKHCGLLFSKQTGKQLGNLFPAWTFHKSYHVGDKKSKIMECLKKMSWFADRHEVTKSFLVWTDPSHTERMQDSLTMFECLLDPVDEVEDEDADEQDQWSDQEDDEEDANDGEPSKPEKIIQIAKMAEFGIEVPKKDVSEAYDIMKQKHEAMQEHEPGVEDRQQQFLESVKALPYSSEEVKMLREKKAPWSHSEINQTLGNRYMNCMDLLSLLWSPDEKNAFVSREQSNWYMYIDWLMLVKKFMATHYRIVEINTNNVVPAKQLHDHFLAYCRETNPTWSEEISRLFFPKYMEKLGYIKKRVSSGNVYIGLTLK